MATLDKGLALVSVADVLFFDPTTGNYMGDGYALTNSTVTQEMKNIETRGGYLNSLLFNIMHSKTLSVKITSATFKMEYLAFQTGTAIVTGLSGIYQFNECVNFTNGVGTTANVPLGNVYVRMPNGSVNTVTPTGSSVNIGLSTYTGALQVVYQYNASVNQLTIDTKTQPLTLKTVLKIHTLTQDGVEGELQITIPRLKFDGAIELSLTSDNVSAISLNGMAQEYTTTCGESYYADAKFVQSETTTLAVADIVASPNSYTFSLAGTKTATATIIGLRNGTYSNIVLDNTAVTFTSSQESVASVNTSGLITGLTAGKSTITAAYEGFQDTISVTVTE